MPAEPARALRLVTEAEPPPGDVLPPLPAQPRWWGRPLAETRWQLELLRLTVDPVWAGAGVPHGDGRPVVLMPGFLERTAPTGEPRHRVKKASRFPRRGRTSSGGWGHDPRGRGRMKRTIVLLCGLAPAALSLGASTASAAVVCTPTTYTQDAHLLTAALINPPDGLVPSNLDATGCDIGIFINDGNTHTLVNKSVFGATYYGVLSVTAGTTNITKSSVYDIGEQPSFSGAQHGISVAYRDGADGQVDHSQLYDYQKGGVLANGAGTDVQVLSNVVRGQGPTPIIAQNGVQVSRSATGHVNDNVIEDHQYTGCTKQQAHDGTCTFVVSTGILLFQVDPSLVDTKNNLFRNNDANLLNASNAGP